ncbi:MAG: shikimate kinase [Bacteroidia bacterium]|nr:shikimate kinase [Bacteroidia bacterium]
MPGSGKTTLGKKLAAKLKLPFFDLDQQITQISGRSPAQWLQESGEAAFRQEEAKVLRNFASHEKCIISCGGGTPCFENNLDWMQENGTCIFIEMPLEALAQRLSQTKGTAQRPLLHGPANELSERLKMLWKQREPYFNQITMRVNGLHPNLRQLIQEIEAM